MDRPMNRVRDATIAESVTLEAWLDRHGPLSTRSALLLCLRILAQASQLGQEQLRRTIGSLAMPFIHRRAHEDWGWMPVPSTGSATAVHASDIIERTGVVLFTCLTGLPPAPGRTPDAVRSSLRLARPDLAAHVSEAVARMTTARTSAAPVTYESIADELRHLATVATPQHTTWERGLRWWTLALLTLVLTGWTLGRKPTDADLEPGGLTHEAARAVTATNESVNTLALNDEHTASIQLLQVEEQTLRQLLTPEDPRVAWNGVRQAWVRTLAGDDLTAEQLLPNKLSWFDAQLGAGHPYGRAARLMLAAVLKKRGAAGADALEAEAAHAAAALLGDPERVQDLLHDLPSPSGVIAHVAPNAPEREGFARNDGGAYRAQLTSTVLWIAGRDGWRLHMVATDQCRATMVVGTNPREITLGVERSGDRWHATVSGTQRALSLSGDDRQALAVSLIGDPAGVQLHLDESAVSAVLDPTAPAPIPPYALSFQGRTPDACRVVWAEVPLPRSARTGVRPGSD
jgi:hypothetical protein